MSLSRLARTSTSSSSARRLTAPSRSRSWRRFSSRRSTSTPPGSGASALWPASAARPDGSQSSSLEIACLSSSSLHDARLRGALRRPRAARARRSSLRAPGGRRDRRRRARFRRARARRRPLCARIPPGHVRPQARGARRAKVGRRVGEAGALPLRFRQPLGEFGDAALRPIAPLMPGRPLAADRGAPRGARRSLARDRLRRRPRFGEGGPLTRRLLARVLEALGDIVARPELLKRGFGVGLAFGRLIARRAGARKGLLDRRQARECLGALALELRKGVAGGVRRSRARRGPARAIPFPPRRLRGPRWPRSPLRRSARPPPDAPPRLRAQGRQADSFPPAAERPQSALRRRRRSRPSARDPLRARPAAGRA